MSTFLTVSLAALLFASAPPPSTGHYKFPVPPAEREKIRKALPATAPAKPLKHRRLLIFDLNVGYPGHPSAAHAALAFTLMGKETGAFETVETADPRVFRPESLKTFDALFFNNTVGNLFRDPLLRRSLVEFVYAGGGLFGTHGTTVAFTRWPGAHEDWVEFGRMLGGRGARHRENRELVTVKLDDPAHPLNRPFEGKSFQFRDEFFRVSDPYSRSRVRVLLSIDTEKTDVAPRGPWRPERADGDYALAWIRNYGRGRVFYCTIGHNPYVFWDPRILRFYLGALQFVLGDLSAPTTPSAKLTPAVRAREKLGWRVGLSAPRAASALTFFEAVDEAARLGVSYIEAASGEIVGGGIPKPFGPGLTASERETIRLKLDSAGVRVLSYRTGRVPADRIEIRALFDFGRKFGIEAIVGDPSSASVDTLAELSRTRDIVFAVESPERGALKPGSRVLVIEPPRPGSGLGQQRIVRLKGEVEEAKEVLAELASAPDSPLMLGIDWSPEKTETAARTLSLLDRVSVELAR